AQSSCSTPYYHSLSSRSSSCVHRALHSFPTRRSSDLVQAEQAFHPIGDVHRAGLIHGQAQGAPTCVGQHVDVAFGAQPHDVAIRSEEHTSELQSRENLVCRLLLEKKKKNTRHKDIVCI